MIRPGKVLRMNWFDHDYMRETKYDLVDSELVMRFIGKIAHETIDVRYMTRVIMRCGANRKPKFDD